MKKSLLLLCSCAFFLAFCSSPESKDAADSSKASNTEVKNEEKIKLLDFHGQDKPLKDVIAAEYAAGRTPVVYFWASWCGPCKEFKASLPDPLMQDALNNVTLIMVDQDKDEKYGSAFGVSGIPAFVKVDKSGEMVDLVDGGAWEENIPENMAPVLKDFMAGGGDAGGAVEAK